MEFDKTKVYTALNAEELKCGSRCIFAHNLSYLRDCVEDYEIGSIETLTEVRPENYCDRFFDGTEAWNLAYLVEEPAKLKWIDLKIGDVITNGKRTAMVTEIDKECSDNAHIYAGYKWFVNAELEKWEIVK